MSRSGTDGAGAAPVVALHDVWRRYRVHSARRPRSLRASLSTDPLRRHPHRWHWALRGVDLEVGRGEALAVVGRNGAGKSTLLRLIGGIGRPDRGALAVTGRVGALIDLGNEFHPDLTGRQNAELAAVVAGMTRRRFRELVGEIVDFAGLHDFIDEPLRVYSDGMRARLAFSVVAHGEPDVLLVDEVLAVGDVGFQRRSVERIAALRGRGAAVVFVSHDMALVRRVCERAVWLDHGEIRSTGPAVGVVDDFLAAAGGDPPGPEAPSRRGAGLLGTIGLWDEWGSAASAITSGDGLTVGCDVAVDEDAPRRRLRVRIVRPSTGTAVVDTSTPVDRSRAMRVRFERLDLAPGDHRVEVALFADDWSAVVDECAPAPLTVRGVGPETAPLAPPHAWEAGPLAPGG